VRDQDRALARDSLLVSAGLFGVLLLAALLNACGPAEPPYCAAPSAGSSIEYIKDGTISVDRRATAWVHSGGIYCTATIIGPFTALTAAHCAYVDTLAVSIILDPRLDAEWHIAPYDIIVHPNYDFPRHDLAIIHIDPSIYAPLPEPYAQVGLQGAECTSYLAQGYGKGSFGTLAERPVLETYHANGILEATTATCKGDSGGPLYALKEGAPPILAGVTSYGHHTEEDPICGPVSGYVDLQADGNGAWVRENIR
jgi:hypothetical protein